MEILLLSTQSTSWIRHRYVTAYYSVYVMEISLISIVYTSWKSHCCLHTIYVIIRHGNLTDFHSVYVTEMSLLRHEYVKWTSPCTHHCRRNIHIRLLTIVIWEMCVIRDCICMYLIKYVLGKCVCGGGVIQPNTPNSSVFFIYEIV